MNWILSKGFFRGTIPENLSQQAEFRRATRNQMMAYLALQECFQSVPSEKWVHNPRLGIVLGTSHGELDSTVSFLGELGLSGTARPFYFQSSLHHSILGFLTKVFSLTGPSLTVCNCYQSGENALDAADLLLEGTVDACLVVGVDALVPKIAEPLLSMYPPETRLGEGAGALLIANARGKDQWGNAIACDLRQEKVGAVSDAVPSLYDSSAIEWVAKRLTTASAHSQVSIGKPDGTFSHLSWKAL